MAHCTGWDSVMSSPSLPPFTHLPLSLPLFLPSPSPLFLTFSLPPSLPPSSVATRYLSVWCRLEDTQQEMIEQRAELQREQLAGESGRGGVWLTTHASDSSSFYSYLPLSSVATSWCTEKRLCRVRRTCCSNRSHSQMS